MASLPIFSIPGNIKQSFLPFVIDPSKDINKIDEHAGSGPQLFTYKNNMTAATEGGGLCLGFYPSTSFYQYDIKGRQGDLYNSKSNLDEEDVSFQTVYGSNRYTKNPLKIDDIISTLPGVSIREFLPDTRLNQCLNFFKELFGEMGKTMIAAKNFKSDSKDESSKFTDIFDKIVDCAAFTINYMTGNGDYSFANDFIKNAGKNIPNMNNPVFSYGLDKKYIDYVQEFPYILYYKLQSCTTTNIYEVPAMCEGKPIMSSDGKAGWGDGSDFMGAGGFRATGFLDKIPLVGTIANMILGNIGVNYMPWWNAETGSKVTEPEVTVKFDLFNDSVAKAIVNFVFVNTIVPSNKWLQYNVFQHSSNLYDVKIDGVNRLFACAASFTVTYDGVLRNPSQTFFDLLKTHVSGNITGDGSSFIENIKNNNLIKIPDVYHVEMQFRSLLPANFNNFIYSYSYNVKHIINYSAKSTDSTIGEALGKTVRQFGSTIKNIWNGMSSDKAYSAAQQENNQKDKAEAQK